MTIPQEHTNNCTVHECGCLACQHVATIIAEAAERMERRYPHVFASELQNRVEEVVRVCDNNGAEAVHVVRKDGTPGLIAPLDDDADIRRIIRIRMMDSALSTFKLKQNTQRSAMFDSQMQTRDDEDLDTDEQQHRRSELTNQILQDLDPLERVVLWMRLAREMTRCEIEELLGISPKATRCAEERAMKKLDRESLFSDSIPVNVLHPSATSQSSPPGNWDSCAAIAPLWSSGLGV